MAERLDPGHLDSSDLDGLTLPVLPLANGVVLPQMVVTLALETDEAKAAGDAAVETGQILLVPRFDSGRYGRVGTIANIENRGTLPGGTPALVVRATARAHVGAGVIGTTAALWVGVEPVAETPPTERAGELARDVRAAVSALFDQLGGRRLTEVLRGADDPGALADLAGWWPDLAFERKVELLETTDVEERLAKVLEWVKEAMAELEVSARIRKEVSDGLEKNQREFLLRQQMSAIRKELGEDGDDEDLVDEYRATLAALSDAGALTEKTREAIEREIGRLERTPAQNMEHGWIRTWLDTVLGIPWADRTTDDLDIDDARRILDEDHTGLDEVKERIVEFLAVRKLRAERGLDDAGDDDPTQKRKPGAIVALVGPPGVGKTSLGASVARALGRKFVRVALGGIRDEAEVRGHRRTYVGAQPGRIVRAITEAGTMNPVFLLDEVDKVGADWRGDPSSALLEVLDPAQNHSFRDHYLEVDLDLSDVLFIATANVMETIPGPLLDRMEIVRLDGYTEDEKVAIARDHLVDRQIGRNGLRDGEVVVTEGALRGVVADYTREAGVRNLERELGKILRKAATKIAAGTQTPVTVDAGDLVGYLGRQRFFSEVADRTAVPGVATGLAVTGAGGDVLFVEATSMQDGGDAGLTVTGQLGDVMKESAQIALSYVRSKADELGIDASLLNQKRFHVHFPAGAVPKDGPSAGITMTTALVSLLTQRPVRNEVGMTGEVTLSGRVLPIGGVKQKVLAAHRAGLTEVILPARNEADIDDVPDKVRDEMTFHFVDTVDKVFDLALDAETAEVAPHAA
ncbi:MAG TPA: endopeptidase La [Acidimicrobiales bacterium]|jgi:ATP-dependent Lon protease|nr:endopeptidase La [Acidimicrobiales bacterium]